MKHSLITALGLFASATAHGQLPSDQHWSYDLPQIDPEPFAMLYHDSYLYIGGLFDGSDQVGNTNNFLRFQIETKTWEQVPGLSNGVRSGLNGRVDDISLGDDGRIYVSGNFSTPAGTSAQRVASFDPDAADGDWRGYFDSSSNLSTPGWDNGPTPGQVRAVVKLGNFLYIGGNFTATQNPDNEDFCLRYDLTQQRWEPVGDGTLGQVDDFLVVDGELIAATRNDAGLMRWDGTNWSTYAGGIGGTGIVRVIKQHPDGRIFIGGSFDQVGTNNLSCGFIAAYNPMTNSWDNLDGGFDDEYTISNGTSNADGIFDIRITSEGLVYAGGDIQANPDRSNLGFRHIAQWDGSGEWKTMGSGLGSTDTQIVSCLALGPDEELYAGGTFSRGWEDEKSANTQFAVWDPERVLTPIPASEEDPIITNENGTLFLHLRTVQGTQYKIDENSTLPFPAGDQFGRFGGGNLGLLKRELGPASEASKKFYRVRIFR